MKKNQKKESPYDLELLISILSFRSRTKHLDHYRRQIEEIILPYEEKHKESIEK